MSNVAVLMSTYNGQTYVREQIDCILAQKDVNVQLFIRDDGSSDDTVSIVKEYTEKFPNVHLLQGPNLGVGSSFMDLVYHVKTDYDYYAFADQDDNWLPEKISSGVSKLQGEEGPVLYCSNQILVDKDKNRLGMRHKDALDCSWMQIMCNNKISGCTMVWNCALQAILYEPSRRPTPELLRIRIQDVWVGMVAASVGKVIYDENSYILYRQHENNVVGVRETSHLDEYKKKLKKKHLRRGRSTLAYEVSSKYGDLLPQDTLTRLSKYGNYRRSLIRRFGMFKEKEIYRHTGESAWAYRLKVLLGLF